MGAEDGAVLKEGIKVLDELLFSDFALTKAVLISFVRRCSSDPMNRWTDVSVRCMFICSRDARRG